MGSMNLVNEVRNLDIDIPEKMLGKGLMMPFNASNSGVRKLMFGVQSEQRLSLLHPEVAFIQTGYEKQFGEYASSYIVTEGNLQVIGRIPKFSKNPTHHYYVILADDKNKTLTMYERKQYKHVTESYGYLFNNDQMDRLSVGDIVPKGTVIQKSEAYDEYNNREDGINLLTVYGASERNMEDGIIISESAAKRMTSPLIKKVEIMINENETPLNLYGNSDIYKIFPDIGENTVNGILCGVRVEKKEEILFSQSWDRLRELFISDQPYIAAGTVVDIDIYPNNIETITTNEYYSQINYYYQEDLRMCGEIVSLIDTYTKQGYHIASDDYRLQELYFNSNKKLNQTQFFSERVYNNLIMKITVLDTIPILRGDKMCNRYGGKGVTSCVEPDELMPITKSGQKIDVVVNMCGVYGRENAGQLFETTISYISIKILELCQTEGFDIGQCIEMYLRLIEIVSPSFHKYVSRKIEDLSDDDLFNYIVSVFEDRSIFLVIEPMSENMTIDKVQELYDAFPFIKPERVMMPIIDSNGNVRYVESRRPLVYGYQYFYRLKQYAEEKFSVTSLSSTNVRNENTRNKSSNSFKALYSRTPIRFGEMETGNLNHLGAELIVQMLMLYSTSPQARRLTQSLMTDDPFDIDVKLDDYSTNRSAEILNVYLKEIGLRIVFKKKKKEKAYPIAIEPISYDHSNELQDPLVYYDENIPRSFIDRDINRQLEREHKRGKLVDPIDIYPIDYDVPVDNK